MGFGTWNLQEHGMVSGYMDFDGLQGPTKSTGLQADTSCTAIIISHIRKRSTNCHSLPLSSHWVSGGAAGASEATWHGHSLWPLPQE